MLPADSATPEVSATFAVPDAVPKRPQRPVFEPVAKVVVEKAEGTLPAYDAAADVLVRPLLEAEGFYVVVPRAVAEATPVLAPLAKTVSTTEPAAVPLPIFAQALAVVAQWVAKKGAQGTSATAFPNPVTHPDLDRILSDESEKEIVKHLLGNAQATIGALNFAEANGMKGLYDFLVVAFSCTLRGKTDVEMAHAMGHDGITDADVAAGKAAYPQLYAKTEI